MVHPEINSAPGTSGPGVPALRLWPLALATIWACTVLSVEVVPRMWDSSLWRFGIEDLFVNIVLYVPLGVALRRRGALSATAIGAVLSVGAELTQLIYPDRFTAGTDVAANVAGTFIGYALSNRFGRDDAWGFDPIPLSTRTVGFVAVVFVVAATVLTRPGRPSDFSNWDPECRVIVADELTRNRPWNGRIEALAIFDSCFAKPDITQLSHLSPDAWFYSGAASRRLLITARPPADLDSIRGIPLMGPSEHERLFNALVSKGQLTVLVRFRTAGEDQSGPARIAGYSKSQWAQNFSLGQEGREINFRLRTPTTSPGGFNPQSRTRPILVKNRDTVVAATYDGRNVRVYVDGASETRLNLRAEGKLSPFLSDHGLPAAASMLGALLGVAAVGLAGPRAGSLTRATGWGSLGGLLGGIAFVAGGGADALPEFQTWIPVVASWGGAVAGCASVLEAP